MSSKTDHRWGSSLDLNQSDMDDDRKLEKARDMLKNPERYSAASLGEDGDGGWDLSRSFFFVVAASCDWLYPKIDSFILGLGMFPFLLP